MSIGATSLDGLATDIEIVASVTGYSVWDMPPKSHESGSYTEVKVPVAGPCAEYL